MSARYIIRLDDACPTMSDNWDRIEALLDKYNVRPMIGVIPDNKDQSFLFRPADPDFWQKVKGWQNKGWVIALHGYDHIYKTKEGGLVPINDKSEFAGLELSEQRDKIKKGWQIFVDNNIPVDTWIAPAHSFDTNTLEALRTETSITTVSDGISLMPFKDQGFNWIPQQLWKFKKMPFGIFTICLHPNTMKEKELSRFEQDLEIFKDSVIDPTIAQQIDRKKGLADSIFAYIWWKLYKIKKQRIKSRAKQS
jgi:predicted deacetylase